MTTLRIEHPITDYDTWRGAFERAAPFREQAGVSNYRVQRPIDDPHYLMIDLDFDDVAGAESLLAILRGRIWASPDSSGVISASGGHVRLIEAATGIEPVYRALQYRPRTLESPGQPLFLAGLGAPWEHLGSATAVTSASFVPSGSYDPLPTVSAAFARRPVRTPTGRVNQEQRMATKIETRTVMSKGEVAALPQLLDINQVAGHLGVTTRHVRRLVAERRIPYLKWGHLLRFDPEELAAWLDRSRIHQVTP